MKNLAERIAFSKSLLKRLIELDAPECIIDMQAKHIKRMNKGMKTEMKRKKQNQGQPVEIRN
jgi:hypothetical protein